MMSRDVILFYLFVVCCMIFNIEHFVTSTSSTEAEIVGTSEYVPFPMWLAMFMCEQGYPMSKNILF